MFKIIDIIRFYRMTTLENITGERKKYPRVIQLPITYKCNSRCVMCNIWKMDNSDEADVVEFKKYMSDDLFKKVEFVGINGGEPSLIKNLPDYANEILKLPRLKSLNIISHGFNQKSLLDSVEKIYESCKKRNVSFHISISLDGVEEVHNSIRRRENVFQKTISTITEIKNNQGKYCDSYDLGCTVVKQNAQYLMELDSYTKISDLNIKYRLGIVNKRIESDKIQDQFSVIRSGHRQDIKEFFHYQMSETRSLYDKFKYFSIFSWLNQEKPKRLLGCIWKDEGVTLDSRGELYYCAVASRSLGTLREKSGKDIFFNDENIKYRKSIIQNSCDQCIHDYSGRLEIFNVYYFLKEMLFNRYAMNFYRFKIRFSK